MSKLHFTLTLGFGAILLGAAERFDHKVRDDFFAGISGDAGRLQRAMQISEETLQQNPKHAEALVWHGAGLFSMGGQAFQQGNREKGADLVQRGTKEMDEAAALAPDNAAVRIPRGAAYLNASRFMPSAVGKPILLKGLSDYEHILGLQKDVFETLGVHPRGELLFGIAEGRSRAGDMDKAAEFFLRIEQELPATAYAKRAALWRETKSLPLDQTGCIGCHVK